MDGRPDYYYSTSGKDCDTSKIFGADIYIRLPIYGYLKSFSLMQRLPGLMAC